MLACHCEPFVSCPSFQVVFLFKDSDHKWVKMVKSLRHADGSGATAPRWDCYSDHAQASSDLERLQKGTQECPDGFTVLPFVGFSYSDRPLCRTPIYSNYQLLPMLSINVLFVIECADVKHLLEKCLKCILTYYILVLLLFVFFFFFLKSTVLPPSVWVYLNRPWLFGIDGSRGVSES